MPVVCICESELASEYAGIAVIDPGLIRCRCSLGVPMRQFVYVYLGAGVRYGPCPPGVPVISILSVSA
ncbi:hypothetical protein NG798_25275 [Ancylothrix sp. C2]|uniref:hypothetical protein n=1 Tax=Ancylothrix sp. D3o TaxID=2953691 RepID=UPI0021BB737C|nr:hypothetical protein [Ancylothrix sp. D3o]MCT7953114.1 hypothetical protein [Ancylothrix sp. D3o]